MLYRVSAMLSRTPKTLKFVKFHILYVQNFFLKKKLSKISAPIVRFLYFNYIYMGVKEYKLFLLQQKTGYKLKLTQFDYI